MESGLKVLSGLEIQSGRALCNFREHGGDALEHFRYMCVDDACMWAAIRIHTVPQTFFFLLEQEGETQALVTDGGR